MQRVTPVALVLGHFGQCRGTVRTKIWALYDSLPMTGDLILCRYRRSAPLTPAREKGPVRYKACWWHRPERHWPNNTHENDNNKYEYTWIYQTNREYQTFNTESVRCCEVYWIARWYRARWCQVTRPWVWEGLPLLYKALAETCVDIYIQIYFVTGNPVVAIFLWNERFWVLLIFQVC